MFGGVDCFPGEAGIGFLSGGPVESEVRAGGVRFTQVARWGWRLAGTAGGQCLL